jgi:hypothetical protein
MAIAEELENGTTGYLIKRALDEARAQYFRLPSIGQGVFGGAKPKPVILV